ncbi:hypothetical protein GGI05_006522, partial [Coemansia sp. RSA 2603]
MVPNIKCAEITWYNFVFSNIDQSLGSLIDDSAINIFRGLRSFGFIEYGNPDRPTQIVPEYFSDLTHFDYKFNHNHSWFAELVRYNAGTLE